MSAPARLVRCGLARFLRCRKGGAGVEFAIIAPVLILATVVGSATKSSGVTASPAPAQFCGCASATGVASNACNTSCPAGGTAGTYVSVNASASYSPMLPYPFLPSALTLSSQAIVRTN